MVNSPNQVSERIARKLPRDRATTESISSLSNQNLASIAATGLNPFPKIDDVATPNLDWLREMDDSVAASVASIAATGLNPFPKIDDVAATNLDWLRDMNNSVAASVASLAAPNLDLFRRCGCDESGCGT